MTDGGAPYREAVAFLNERIAYLQGSTRLDGPVPAALLQSAYVPGTRCEFEIVGVGRESKEPPPPPGDPLTWRSPFDDFLAGAYTYRVPVCYRISSGEGHGLSLRMGTWSSRTDDVQTCERRTQVLAVLLSTLYPLVDRTASVPVEPARESGSFIGGLVLGHPWAKAPVPGDNALPLDRVVRALSGRAWRATVLAAPESAALPQHLRESLVAELGFAHSAQRSAGDALPIVEQLTALVRPTLVALLEAGAMGSWRTAVYLEADAEAYPVLSSVWRSVFAAERPAPEALHVRDIGRQAGALAEAWAIPHGTDEPEDSRYRHPFTYQTLLNCGQLAAYVHLPSLEVPGFTIDLAPRFDVNVGRLGRSERRAELGWIVNRTVRLKDDRRPETPDGDGPVFSVSLPSLAGHAFIAGITGSGKTTTCQQLLRAADSAGVPFLVIEPSKREYRELSSAGPDGSTTGSLQERLDVYSVSGEEGIPLRINPFETPPGTSVSEHIDLLRAVFAAGFGDMWTPLPQVLERCLRRIYEQRGWDLEAGHNARLAPGDDPALAFPTLRELAASIDDVVDELGFDPEARDRVRGSLATRVDGLRAGTRGLLFDHRASFPMGAFLAGPAVLELERLADDSDKAFLIALLVIRLVEHRRAERRGGRPAGGLRHLLVIEEAHRLLANVTAPSVTDSTARAAAVEAFSNLLAEIRADGQGIVVLDQVPTKLAPDVIRNTNLKIAHRVVDEADRSVLAGSMAMGEAQKAALSALPRGEAVVFGEGDDAPLRVKIRRPPTRGAAITALPTSPLAAAPPHWGHAGEADATDGTECETSRLLLERDAVRHSIQRLASGALAAATVEEVSWEELVELVRGELVPGEHEDRTIDCLAGRGAEWLADEWGARWNWSFPRTQGFAEALRRLVVETVGAGARERASERTGMDLAPSEADRALAAYQDTARPMHAAPDPRYLACDSICTADLAGTCLFRHSAAMTLERADMWQAWEDARLDDSEGHQNLWAACLGIVAPEILGPMARPEHLRAAALCFAQQAAAAEPMPWPPWLRAELVADLIAVGEADQLDVEVSARLGAPGPGGTDSTMGRDLG